MKTMKKSVILFLLLLITATTFSQTKTFTTNVKLKKTPNLSTPDSIVSKDSNGILRTTSIADLTTTLQPTLSGDFVDLTTVQNISPKKTFKSLFLNGFMDADNNDIENVKDLNVDGGITMTNSTISSDVLKYQIAHDTEVEMKSNAGTASISVKGAEVTTSLTNTQIDNAGLISMVSAGWVQNNVRKLTKYIYINDYDIDITGVSSSADAVQSALDDATSDNNVVVFPVGELLVQNLVIPENTKIVAKGCVFQYGGGNPTGYVANSENSQNGIFHAYGTDINTFISNIEIDGGEYVGSRVAGDWSTFAEMDAIQMMFIDGLIIKNTTVRDWEQDGIEIKSCDNVLIENNFIVDVVDAGIEVRAGNNITVINNNTLRTRNLVAYKQHQLVDLSATYFGNDLTVKNNNGELFGNGILLNWCNNSLIDNNYLKAIDVTGEVGTSEVGLVLENHPSIPNPSTMENITISNNTIEGVSGNSGMRVKQITVPVSNIKVIDNVILTASSLGISFQASGFINGNKINDSSVIGIEAHASGDMYISKNTASTIFIAVTSGDFNHTIKDNILTSKIQLFNTVGSVIIDNNVSSRITSIAGLDDVRVVNNEVTNTTATAIDVNGDRSFIFNNKIKTTGSFINIKTTGVDCIVKNNNINQLTGGQPPIQVSSASHYALIDGNIINSTSTAPDILISANDCVVTNNNIDGGNHGIRVEGDRNYIDSNIIQTIAFNGIQIQATADATILGTNTIVGATTDVSNSGTNTTSLGFNGGYVVEKYGSDTIANASSTKVVTHGLSVTPTFINLTGDTNEHIWYSSITSTQFTVNRTGITGALNFGWESK